ncbi:hypothetical protein [Leucobacter soli]|uniref:hypothetical protein n=1 Tax=Leucobacter soli TaxID=2812850 RepID=UPI001C4083AA|nr:hypothetical protein [Leucobacter soli]
MSEVALRIDGEDDARERIRSAMIWRIAWSGNGVQLMRGVKGLTGYAVAILVAFSLAAGGVAPAAADESANGGAEFAGVRISSLPAKLTQPTKGRDRQARFRVNVSGSPTADGGRYWVKPSDVRIELVDYINPSKLSAKWRRADLRNGVSGIPQPWRPSEDLEAGVNSFKILYDSSARPGKYELRVKVRHQVDGTTTVKETRATFTVQANPSASRKWSNSHSWITCADCYFSGPRRAVLVAPEWQLGAKVTAYCKAQGKKWRKAATAKVKKGATYKAMARIKLPSRCKVGDKVYLKVAKVKYAPKYQTKAMRIR